MKISNEEDIFDEDPEEIEDNDSEGSHNKIKQIKYNEEEELLNSDDDQVEESEEEENGDKDEDEPHGGNKTEKNKDDTEGEGIVEITHDQDGNYNIDICDDIDDMQMEKLNELLFCVQGIGKFKNAEKTLYEKGQYCEPSLRDIHRFLRKDDPENPLCRYALLQWKVCETDIIPLLLNYENNDKIQQLCLVILVDICESLPDLVEKRQPLEAMMTDLQEAIINSQLIELLSRTLADSTAKLREATIMKNELRLLENPEEAKFSEGNVDEEDMKKSIEIKKKIADIENKSQQAIELIFAFFKQILNITDSKNIMRNVKSNIILFKKFSMLRIFDAIVFHSQNYDDDFYKQLSGTMLELVSYIVRFFNTKQIFENVSAQNENASRPMTELQRLLHEEKIQMQNRQALYSTRPNNFGTSIKVTRPLDNTSFIVSNISQLIVNPHKLIAEKTNQFSQQRHKARGRNALFRTKTKKMAASKAGEEIKLINDIMLGVNFSMEIEILSAGSTQMNSIKQFCEEFLKNSLNEMVKYFFIEIVKNEKIEKYDVYHVINIMAFFLDFNRHREFSFIQKMKSQNPEGKISYEFNLEYVKECISPDIMSYVYNLAFNETMTTKNEKRKLFELFSGIRYLKQVLLTSLDLYKYSIDKNLTYNVMIQDYLITKDFSKIIKGIFLLYNEHYHPVKLLYDSIELTEVYFSALDLYSKKRKLKRKIKKKKKPKKGDDDEDEDEDKQYEELKDFIEKDPNDEAGDDKSEHTGSVSLSEDSAAEYIERDVDVNAEAKCLLDYDITSKILSLFNVQTHSSGNMNSLQQIIYNLKKENNVIKFITKLFERIVIIMKSPWIFYQMDYLFIFNSLLNEPSFNKDAFFHPLKTVILKTLNGFFQSVRINKMLPVECLFRFSSGIIKDSVLNNYDAIAIQEDAKDFLPDDHKSSSGQVNEPLKYEEGENYYKPLSDNKGGEEEYTGNLEFLLNKEKKKKKERKEEKENNENDYNERVEISHKKAPKAKWSETEDTILIKNYFDFKDFETLDLILCNLLPEKNVKDIHRRIKKLKLKKGIEKAMKKFRKYHKISKGRDRNLVDVIIELSDECKNEDKKQKIEKTIAMIKEQLESYKVRKGLMENNLELECVLIPTSEEEIDTMKNASFQTFIKTIGFVPPEMDIKVDLSQEEEIMKAYCQKKIDNFESIENKTSSEPIIFQPKNNNTKFWTINPRTDIVEIAIMIEKLDDFERAIQENVEDEDPIREEEKRRAMEAKKLRKKEKKKKKKMDDNQSNLQSSNPQTPSKQANPSEKNISLCQEKEKSISKNDYYANDIYEAPENKNIDEENNFNIPKSQKKKKLKKGLKGESSGEKYFEDYD